MENMQLLNYMTLELLRSLEFTAIRNYGNLGLHIGNIFLMCCTVFRNEKHYVVIGLCWNKEAIDSKPAFKVTAKIHITECQQSC